MTHPHPSSLVTSLPTLLLCPTSLSDRDLVQENRGVNAVELQAEFEAGHRDLETFRQDLLKYQQQLADINSIPPVQ